MAKFNHNLWVYSQKYSRSEHLNTKYTCTCKVCKRGTLKLKSENTSTRADGYFYKIFIGKPVRILGVLVRHHISHAVKFLLTNGNPSLRFDWNTRINADQLYLGIQVEKAFRFPHRNQQTNFQTSGDQFLTSS